MGKKQPKIINENLDIIKFNIQENKEIIRILIDKNEKLNNQIEKLEFVCLINFVLIGILMSWVYYSK